RHAVGDAGVAQTAALRSQRRGADSLDRKGEAVRARVGQLEAEVRVEAVHVDGTLGEGTARLVAIAVGQLQVIAVDLRGPIEPEVAGGCPDPGQVESRRIKRVAVDPRLAYRVCELEGDLARCVGDRGE